MMSTRNQRNPKHGDLIKYRGRGGYQHWAVYIGDGYVVHLTVPTGGSVLSSRSKPVQHDAKVTVKKDTLKNAGEGYQRKINNSLDDRYIPWDTRIIVTEALSQVGTKPIAMNCQQFATDLRYGQGESRQNQWDPKPGDLIEITQKRHQYWVVFIGDGCVVYLTVKQRLTIGSSTWPAKQNKNQIVCKDKLDVAVEGCGWKINNSQDAKYKPRDADDIVKEARRLVGTKYLPDKKCKCFTTNLRYGQVESRQNQRYPKPGDLIEIFQSGYEHWAVYIGNGCVVHLTVPNGVAENVIKSVECIMKAIVKEDTLKKAVQDCKWKINNLLDDKYIPRHPDDIVEDAISLVLVKEHQYHLLSHNCEHFATKLRYGQGESRQVRNLPQRLLAWVSSLW